MQMMNRKAVVNGAAIQERALQLAVKMKIEGFGASSGWLANFQHRHGIKVFVQHGEAGAANLEGVKHAREKLPEFIAREVSWLPKDCLQHTLTGCFNYN